MSSSQEFELFGASGFDIRQAGMKFERWAVEGGIDIPDMDEDEAVMHYDDYANTLMEEQEMDDDELTQEMFMVCKYYGSCFGVWYDERSQDSVDCPEYDEWKKQQQEEYICYKCDKKFVWEEGKSYSMVGDKYGCGCSKKKPCDGCSICAQEEKRKNSVNPNCSSCWGDGGGGCACAWKMLGEEEEEQQNVCEMCQNPKCDGKIGNYWLCSAEEEQQENVCSLGHKDGEFGCSICSK